MGAWCTHHPLWVLPANVRLLRSLGTHRQEKCSSEFSSGGWAHRCYYEVSAETAETAPTPEHNASQTLRSWAMRVTAHDWPVAGPPPCGRPLACGSVLHSTQSRDPTHNTSSPGETPGWKSRTQAAARLDLEVSAGWACLAFRSLRGGDALLLSTKVRVWKAASEQTLGKKKIGYLCVCWVGEPLMLGLETRTHRS